MHASVSHCPLQHIQDKCKNIYYFILNKPWKKQNNYSIWDSVFQMLSRCKNMFPTWKSQTQTPLLWINICCHLVEFLHMCIVLRVLEKHHQPERETKSFTPFETQKIYSVIFTNFRVIRRPDCFLSLPSQLFTATWARMASTTRCVPRTWHHSWRKTRSRWMPARCCWTTTVLASVTSAPRRTRDARCRIAPSPSLNWHGWVCLSLCLCGCWPWGFKTTLSIL